MRWLSFTPLGILLFLWKCNQNARQDIQGRVLEGKWAEQVFERSIPWGGLGEGGGLQGNTPPSPPFLLFCLPLISS